MKIKIKLEVSDDKRTEYVTIDDLGLTNEEWGNLSEEEKFSCIQGYCDSIEQPYWAVDTFEEIK